MAKYQPILTEPKEQANTLGGALKKVAGTVASGAWNLGSKAVTAGANLLADQRTDAERYNDSVAAAKAIVGSNIGSPEGSVRLGPSTPAGVAPFVSFGGSQQTATATPQLAATPTPTPKPAKPAPIIHGTSLKPPPKGQRSQYAGGYVDMTSPPNVDTPPAEQPAATPETPQTLAGQNYGEVDNGDGTFTRIYAPGNEPKLGTFQEGDKTVEVMPFIRKQTTMGVPDSGIAAAPAQTTVGYSGGSGSDGGVYNLGAGQNAPPDVYGMSLGGIAASGINLKRQTEAAQAASLNASAGLNNTNSAIATAEAPLKMEQLGATIDNTRMATTEKIAMLPGAVKKQNKDIETADSLIKERDLMTQPRIDDIKSQVEYRKNMVKNADARLAIHEKQVAIHEAQAKNQKGPAPDWKGREAALAGAIKALNDKAAVGELSTAEATRLQNYVDAQQLAIANMTTTQYIPNPPTVPES